MADEIFRFMTTRPVQRIPEEEGAVLHLYAHQREQTDLFERLTQTRRSGNRREFARLIKEYEASPEFVRSLKGLDPSVDELDRALSRRALPQSRSALVETIATAFSLTPEEIVDDDRFSNYRRRLSDSLLVVTAYPHNHGQNYDYLVRGIRLFALIERLAADDPKLDRQTEIVGALRIPVILPADVFFRGGLNGEGNGDAASRGRHAAHE